MLGNNFNVLYCNFSFFLTLLFIRKRADRMLTVFPRLSAEWIVSFTLRMTTLATSSNYCSIIQLTQGGVFQQHGDRTSAVILYPPRDWFYFSSSINDNPNHYINNYIRIIEIHQRYVNGGEYRYFIKINGEEIASIINTKAQQFYDVKVYASFENSQDTSRTFLLLISYNSSNNIA